MNIYEFTVTLFDFLWSFPDNFSKLNEVSQEVSQMFECFFTFLYDNVLVKWLNKEMITENQSSIRSKMASSLQGVDSASLVGSVKYLSFLIIYI